MLVFELHGDTVIDGGGDGVLGADEASEWEDGQLVTDVEELDGLVLLLELVDDVDDWEVNLRRFRGGFCNDVVLVSGDRLMSEMPVLGSLGLLDDVFGISVWLMGLFEG